MSYIIYVVKRGLICTFKTLFTHRDLFTKVCVFNLKKCNFHVNERPKRIKRFSVQLTTVSYKRPLNVKPGYLLIVPNSFATNYMMTTQNSSTLPTTQNTLVTWWQILQGKVSVVYQFLQCRVSDIL